MHSILKEHLGFRMNLNENFWQEITISDFDLEIIYNHLLEIETPQTIKELTSFLVDNKITEEIKRQDQIKAAEAPMYLPKNLYQTGQEIAFPVRNMQKGKVIGTRTGNNPDYPGLGVMEVEFSPDECVAFAYNLENHKLNDPELYQVHDPNLDLILVLQKFGATVAQKLDQVLKENEDLVCIGGKYFPRSLLVDISVGHLNLAEAVLEMENGGPLSSPELIKQIELPTDVNTKLTEFSFNLAMQEDDRFDEVGPSGETLWFLKRLEPDEVQNTPFTLRFSGEVPSIPDDISQFSNFGSEVCDELEPGCECDQVDEVTISLIYPHLRAGTLPLTSKLKNLFPTAYETPRVKFNFVDGKTQEIFPGWVVRPNRYILGLKDWYKSQGMIAGSLIRISRGINPGEIIIQPARQHNSKEWIRTVLTGSDGGLVYAMLKQSVTCSFDERMAIVTPDIAGLDQAWEQTLKQHFSMEKIVISTMRELAKLNPQGHVHAQELYASVNIIKRCPPSIILGYLFGSPWSSHLGDLYFRLEENKT